MKFFLKTIKMSMLVLATAHSAWALGATAESIIEDAGLTVFVAGQPAKAEEVNDNIANLLNKITELQQSTGGGSINVNCDSDPSALKGAISQGKRTINFTGNCNGPIYPYTRVTLIGSGVSASSINSFSESADDDVVVWNKNGRVDIKNTTINNLHFDTAIGSDQGSEIRLENVNIVGPGLTVVLDGETTDTRCIFARQGSYRLTNVNIKGCSTGVHAAHGSYVRIQTRGVGGSSTITSAGEGTNFPIFAEHNSTVELRNGVTVNNSAIDRDDFYVSVVAVLSSTIKLNGAMVEGIYAGWSSAVEMSSGNIGEELVVDGGSLWFKGGSFSSSVIIEGINSMLVFDVDVDVDELELNGSTLIVEGGRVNANAFSLTDYSSAEFISGKTHNLGDILFHNSQIKILDNSAINGQANDCYDQNDVYVEVGSHNGMTDPCP